MNKLSRQVIAVLLAAGAAAALAQKPSLAERGKYLMEGVVACGNCHTSRR
jgi:mono/diheme cytochrome c family protein